MNCANKLLLDCTHDVLCVCHLVDLLVWSAPYPTGQLARWPYLHGSYTMQPVVRPVVQSTTCLRNWLHSGSTQVSRSRLMSHSSMQHLYSSTQFLSAVIFMSQLFVILLFMWVELDNVCSFTSVVLFIITKSLLWWCLHWICANPNTFAFSMCVSFVFCC